MLVPTSACASTVQRGAWRVWGGAGSSVTATLPWPGVRVEGSAHSRIPRDEDSTSSVLLLWPDALFSVAAKLELVLTLMRQELSFQKRSVCHRLAVEEEVS